MAFTAVTASTLCGQTQESFKWGTFEECGRVFLGLVLPDTFSADIAQANDGLNETRTVIPSEIKELIVRYQDLRPRLYAIANAAAGRAGALSTYRREVKALKILPRWLRN